jgi:dephospho-CoA kinase
MPRPFVIGVTGPIACGKSSVMRLLAERGAETIDADLVYRDLVQAGQPLLGRLVARFGPEILDDGGGLNRRALGTIVFADSEALADLDRLTHPAISEEIAQRVWHSTSSLIAIEAVKLSDSGIRPLCDEVWLVTCNPTVEEQRLIERNGIPAEEAKRRIAAQPVFAENRFTRVIRNDGNVDALSDRVTQALRAATPETS